MVLLIFVALALVIMFGGIMFDIAVYALPAGAGFIAATAAYHAGSGIVGAGAIGFVVAGLLWGFARGLFSMSTSPSIRLALALIFAMPGGCAGFLITHGLFKNSSVASGWAIGWSLVVGLIVAFVSFNRFVAVPSASRRASSDQPPLEREAFPTQPQPPPRVPRRNS